MMSGRMFGAGRLSNTIALGRSLKVSVVLEDIKTEILRQVLIELAGTWQGYLYTKPMSVNDLLEWKKHLSM